jgi:hypothetical protein
VVWGGARCTAWPVGKPPPKKKPKTEIMEAADVRAPLLRISLIHPKKKPGNNLKGLCAFQCLRCLVRSSKAILPHRHLELCWRI